MTWFDMYKGSLTWVVYLYNLLQKNQGRFTKSVTLTWFDMYNGSLTLVAYWYNLLKKSQERFIKSVTLWHGSICTKAVWHELYICIIWLLLYDQGLNPRLSAAQAGALPLNHQELCATNWTNNAPTTSVQERHTKINKMIHFRIDLLLINSLQMFSSWQFYY